jgi:hypothetical protein
MTLDELLNTDLGDDHKLRQIINQWAWEYSGDPELSIKTVTEGLQKLLTRDIGTT